MEADRGAVLTIRAAARGVVDFSRARVRDVGWWRRTNALIRAMDRDDRLVLAKAAFDHQLSLVGNSALTDESFKKSQETARELYQEILNLAEPWAARSVADVKAATRSGLISAYKRLIGDPDDPAFRRKLLADQERLKAGKVAAAPVETQDQKIDRLMRERDEYYKAKGMKP